MSAPLLSSNQLGNIQKLGLSGMTTEISIYAKQAYAKDLTSPNGDDVVEFAATPVVVMGWVVTNPTQDLDQGGGQLRAQATHIVRVPVGTVVHTGDQVAFGGQTYVAIDATAENTWPEWTKVFVRGYNDE